MQKLINKKKWAFNICNDIAEAQKHFPQWEKPVETYILFDSVSMRFYQMHVAWVCAGSKLIPKKHKRTCGCDGKSLSLYCGGYTGIYICQN